MRQFDVQKSQEYDIFILRDHSPMSTLSVPLTVELEQFINDMVLRGVATNKADVVRRALKQMAEDQAVEDVLQSEREIAQGKILRGDLDTLLKQLN
jgi:Arc/MetJ-type ribon-helix-helix transcriptional regulator